MSFKNKKVILVILDGFGIGRTDKTNAIHLAKPQNIQKLMHDYPHLAIGASEGAVALPSGQPGNSEVGHLTIGAGRIFHTGLGLINHEILTRQFHTNKELMVAINYAKKHNSNVHILGLASDGDVHSSLTHLFAMIDMCNTHKVIPILDLFADGRDTPETQFIHDFEIIKRKYLDHNKAKLGTISGRYYAMDRNKNWDRTILTYDTLTSVATDDMDPLTYIHAAYAKKETDEFIKPKSFNNAATNLKEHDSLVFFNFRSDRIRQLIHLFSNNQADYEHRFERSIPVHMVGFMDYKMQGMQNIAFIQPINTVYLGDIVASKKLKQLRIAETEKYAHVTYFLDSMQNEKAKGCDCILIPSPSVATYDLQPSMSASKITDHIIENFTKYDLIVANYANADMVGHTGIMKAAVKAIETLDHEVERLYKAIKANDDYVLIITADHGNADEMLDKNGIIVTRHTTNLVPFIVVDKDVKVADEGSLVNIAPTVLDYLGIEIPSCMEKSLLIK